MLSLWDALWTFGSLASSKGWGIADRHGAFTQKLFKYSTTSKNYVFTTRPPCETGLYNWPCFTAGGSESRRRWATCRRSHKEAVAQQGCWTRILRQVQRTVNPLGSLLLTWVVGADQRMDGEKNQIWVSFFHPRESQLFFSRTPCSRFDTLSPKDFLDVFSCLFSRVLRGGEGGGWGAPEQSGTRLNILFPGESNLSCPQARWRRPSSLHWPSWTGHRVSLPFPASSIPTYLCPLGRRG